MVELLSFAEDIWTKYFAFLKMSIRLSFFDFVNRQHPTLNFTIENKHLEQLSFLTVLNTCSDILTTSVYKKSTFTELLQNYNSFVSHTYKKGLIKTLFDPTGLIAHGIVFTRVQLSEYPPKLID